MIIGASLPHETSNGGMIELKEIIQSLDEDQEFCNTKKIGVLGNVRSTEMAGNFLDDWYEDEDELTLYKPKSPT
jgi:hypothetical protein